MRNIIFVVSVFFVILHRNVAIAEEINALESQELKLNIELQERVAISNNLAMKFLGHGHKKVKIGGPKSPLIVYMEYKYNGTEYREDHYLHPNTDGVLEWAWKDYQIEILEYTYGKNMLVVVTSLIAK